jgi:Holliday junction resolvasome RuvABC endonuclease subunit
MKSLKLGKMNQFGLVSVMGIDLSYRSTGFAVAEISEDCAKITDYGKLENKELGRLSFDNLSMAAKSMHATCTKIIKMSKEHTLTIIEVPSFSQSAKSAMVIGMMWGCVARMLSEINDVILVEPSALKLWSNSDKGDGKERVKIEVLKRVKVDKKSASCSDILDAIGICLMAHDEINRKDSQATFKEII